MSRRKKTLGTIAFMTFFRVARSVPLTKTLTGTGYFVVIPDEKLPEELREGTDTEVIFALYSIGVHPGEPTVLYVENIQVSDEADDLPVRGFPPVSPDEMQHGAQVYFCKQNSNYGDSIYLGRMTRGGELLTSLSQRQKLKAKGRHQETQLN